MDYEWEEGIDGHSVHPCEDEYVEYDDNFQTPEEAASGDATLLYNTLMASIRSRMAEKTSFSESHAPKRLDSTGRPLL